MNPLAVATVSLSTGVLLTRSASTGAVDGLEDLAAIVPEVFGTLDLGCLARIAQRVGADASGDERIELVLLSDSRVQVVHALHGSPELALVAVSRNVGNIGLVLSQVRRSLANHEEPR